MFKSTINAFMYYGSFAFVYTLIKNRKLNNYMQRKVTLCCGDYLSSNWHFANKTGNRSGYDSSFLKERLALS